MRLAIEKLSPLSGKAVLINNVDVVLRCTVIMASLLFFFGTMIGTLQFPLWTTFVVLLFCLLCQNKLAHTIFDGVALRRLRYNGTINFVREPQGSLKERVWISDVPLWAMNKFDASLKDKFAEAFQSTEEREDRLILLIGRNEAGEYVVKKYHSCNSKTCQEDLKHFAYDEKRDGAIHWGSL